MLRPSRGGGDLTWILPLLLLVKFFATGHHCIPELVLCDVVLTLLYTRHCSSWLGFVALYAGATLAASMTIVWVLYQPGMSAQWAGAMLLLQMAVQLVQLLPFICDSIVHRVPYAGAVCFPTAYTGLQLFLVDCSPEGAWGVPAYCLTYGEPRNLALLSFAGLSGVHFVVACAAACLASFCERFLANSVEKSDAGVEIIPAVEWRAPAAQSVHLGRDRRRSPSSSSTSSSDISDSSAAEQRALQTLRVPFPRPPTNRHPQFPNLQRNFTAILLFGVFIYGAFYSSMPRLLAEADTRQTLPLTCIATDCRYASPALLLDLSQQAAASGSKLVMWSERPFRVDKTLETTLLHNATELATTHNIFMGVTYELISTSGTQSFFVLIDPASGEKIKVHRVHDSPFSRGVGVSGAAVRATDTSLGTVGGVMAYDLAFPQHVQKVVTQRTRLVLSPGENYGPIFEMQWNQAAPRAAEVGTTVVMCSHTAGLVAVDPYGNTALHVPISPRDPVKVLSGMVPLGDIHTAYGVLGDAFGFVCLALAVLCLLVGKSRVSLWLHAHANNVHVRTVRGAFPAV